MMEGDPKVDMLMRPVRAAIERHVKDRAAVTDIYNRAYEAVMEVQDALNIAAAVTAKQIAENAKNLQRADAAEAELARLKSLLIAWNLEPDGTYNQPAYWALNSEASKLAWEAHQLALKGGEE